MIDPSKDKFAYFKDNIQTAEDKEDFDASQYYYHRDDFSSKGLGVGAASVAGVGALGGSGMNMAFQGMAGALGGGLDMHADALQSGLVGFGVMGGGSGAFLGAAGGMPMAHELHRLGSADHLAAVVKGRAFQPPAENKAPDMSEFPALGSRMSSLTIDSGFDGAASSSSTLSRQSQPTEFTIQKEDFPALSTLAASGSGSDKSATPRAMELKRHASFTISAADNAVLSSAPARSGATAIGVRAGSASAAESSSNGVSLSGGAFGHLRTEEVPASGVSGMDASNQFGLLGMLHTIIRPGNEAKKNLTMGCDLTSLGLNLNSAEPLHPTFASPWSDDPLAHEPQYSLPMCYYNQPPVLKMTHLSKFHLETLFYIFYSMPKDVLQAYAAQELYAREWRYHGELKLWLKRASAADAALLVGGSANGSSSGSSLAALSASSSLAPAGSSIGSTSTSAGSIGSGIGSSSSGSTASSPTAPQFIYFDTTAWERRAFSGNVQALASGLLTDDEIRVKV